MIRLLLSAAFAMCLSSVSLACGADTDCMVGKRHYRIAMPEGHDGATQVGAIVFAHGYRGSARGAMRNMGMRRMVSDMGLALIAVKSLGDGWDLPNGPRDMDSDGAEEFAYFDAVIRDAAARFSVDTDRIMMTGFSAGGMMTWNLACARPELFAGFAPISGTFWLKPPATCAAPVASIVHIHGTEDNTVPLTGRVIGPTRQGNVFEVLDMYRAFGGFGAAKVALVDNLDCARQDNESGALLEFCTFAGGHSFQRGFLRYAWSRLEAVGKL